jgi:hypothetical protein
MTMLLWKRTDRQCDTQTLAFEELALPLLPSLHNVALWLSRGARFDVINGPFSGRVRLRFRPPFVA